MSEKMPSFENKPEHIPSLEEIHDLFKQIVGEGVEYKVTKTKEDEKGLHALEIEAPGKSEGEMNCYEYRRLEDPNTPQINVAYYENDFPVGGTSVARYLNDAWVFDLDDIVRE